jgi:hypothetical protein
MKYFLLIALLLSPVMASASIGIDLDKIKPLTEVEYIPEEEFNERTRLEEVIPYDDEFLAFKVRLPKEWSENLAELSEQSKPDAKPTQNILGTVARYFSPPNQHLRSFFELEVSELTYEIGARNWFINYVISKGLSLEQVGAEGDRAVEAIYVEVKGDITYIVRVKAIINGPRMVMAHYYLPMELYQEERVLQAQVIKSFELTNRHEVGVEELDIYGFLDQSFFEYPVSWKLSAPYVKSIDRMRAMLHHSTRIGKLDGQINIYLANRMTDTTRSNEIKLYKEKLEIENYELGGFLEQPKFSFHPDMHFGITQVYAMEPKVQNMINYELWVSLMEGEEYIYVVSLLTPARTEEFYTWARNIEAYELVLRGMRRYDDDVDYYEFYLKNP